MKEEDIRKREILNRYLDLVQEDCRLFFNDKSSFNEVDCPACAGQRYLPQFSKDSFDYVTCEDCQTLYARTRPTFEKIKHFYTESKSSDYWVNHFFKPIVEVRREKIFKPRAEYLVNRFKQDPAWLVGDVGAGFGIFLEEMRKFWPESEYVAIEPSSEQAEICRKSNLNVECCALEEVKGYNNRFEMLTAFELIEHIYDPAQFLNTVYDLLKPGGWFLLTTLNGQGFDIQILWKNSKSIYPPCHINFFDPHSLSLLSTSVGFTVEEVETPGQLDWDIVEGMIINENIEAERFWKLLTKEGSPEAKKEFQNWIRRHRFSSHMWALLRKQL